MRIPPFPGRPDGDARFRLDHLSRLLDTMVAMHWDLTDGLHDGADLPISLMTHIENVDREVKRTIDTIRALLAEQMPIQRQPDGDGHGLTKS